MESLRKRNKGYKEKDRWRGSCPAQSCFFDLRITTAWEGLRARSDREKGSCLNTRGAVSPVILAALGGPGGDLRWPLRHTTSRLFFGTGFGMHFGGFHFHHNVAADSGIFFALPVAGVFFIGVAAAADSRALGTFRGYGFSPKIDGRMHCLQPLPQPG